MQLLFSIIRQRCLPGKYILSDGTWFRTKEAQYLNFFIHGANSISCLMDIFISRRPMKLLHFYFSMVYGLAYAIFSIAYWQLGGLGMCVRVDSGSLSSYLPIKMRVFHQIESCLLALSFLDNSREDGGKKGSSHFDATLTLIGHHSKTRPRPST